MSIAAEMDLAPGRGATKEHSPQRSVTEAQRRPGAKDTPPGGLTHKPAIRVVAPPLQIHYGICSMRPAAAALAPVNAPDSCPNNSFSTNSKGKAPQLTALKGLSLQNIFRQGANSCRGTAFGPRWGVISLAEFGPQTSRLGDGLTPFLGLQRPA